MFYEKFKICYHTQVIFPVLLRYLTRFIGNVIYFRKGKGNPWSGNRMFNSFHYFTIKFIFSRIKELLLIVMVSHTHWQSTETETLTLSRFINERVNVALKDAKKEIYIRCHYLYLLFFTIIDWLIDFSYLVDLTDFFTFRFLLFFFAENM